MMRGIKIYVHDRMSRNVLAATYTMPDEWGLRRCIRYVAEAFTERYGKRKVEKLMGYGMESGLMVLHFKVGPA